MNTGSKRSRLFLVATVPLLALSVACAAMPGGGRDQTGAEVEDSLDEDALPQTCGPFDKDWHFLSRCLRSMRDSWSRASGVERLKWSRTARETVEQALYDERTAFESEGPSRIDKRAALENRRGSASRSRAAPDVMIYQRNQLGQPYNGMGQSGMAYFLVQFAQLAERSPGAEDDAAYFRAAAEGILRAVVSPARRGGLMSLAPCRADTRRDCAWFHSITRRDKPADFGVTLNQNLHVLRDLGSISDIYSRNGWQQPFPFDGHVAAGLDQLFLERERRSSGDLPTMADYLTPPVGAARVRWLYYGFNRERPAGEGGYFLGRNGKDCGYQVHVLDLTAQILERAQQKGIWQTQKALACRSALAEAYRGTAIRMRESDPAVWSEPGMPRDTTCKPKHVQKFSRMAGFYRDALARCGDQ